MYIEKKSNKNNTPQKLRIEDVISDEKLLEIHISLLNAVKIKRRYFPKNITDRKIKFIIEGIAENKVMSITRNKLGKTKVSFIIPNYVIRARAINMALKLGGGILYSPATRNMLKTKSGHLSDVELEDLIKKMKDFFNRI